MIQFVKDSIREIQHVVWPTREETKNYFLIVLVTLTLFGIYLFIASSIFSELLFGAKDLLNGDSSQAVNISPEGGIDLGAEGQESSLTVEENTDDSTSTDSETELGGEDLGTQTINITNDDPSVGEESN